MSFINKVSKIFKKGGIEKLKVFTEARIKNIFELKPENAFPLTPNLPLPANVSEEKLFDFLKSVMVANAPPQEMENYCRQDFKRFAYTFGLLRQNTGKCLELGANPYFTTMLLKQFTPLELTCANYFGATHKTGKMSQDVYFNDFETGKSSTVTFKFDHFNIEEESFPYGTAFFDVVLFCEIIEHLLMDPVAVLKEIKRVLKPGGTLILTTPNVSRLENVAKMIGGANIYDPYSGYGPYGRHNREYNKHDLFLLLDYLGFSMYEMFTADVHPNNANGYCSITKIKGLLKNREHDIGQYIFLRAQNIREAGKKKPSFLYRSYPNADLE